ncbi:hypothetical protein QBC43DRAFT_299820 [Cladorrhinum sp. PSN259]|nr:hypothetical protein QBC43DRAFT_299820 [Cladorrhinum sp. PSN259]
MTDFDVDMLDVDDVREQKEPPPTTTKQEVIPPLRTLAPSIFVPLTIDITKPEEEADIDRIGRLRRILESIDYHHQGMKENLLYMFEREKRRMVMEAAEREVALGQHERTKPGIPRPEEDMIIRNMEAPADWKKNYNLTDEKLASYHIRPIPEGAPISVRDSTVVSLLQVVERSIHDLDSLDGFMKNVKDKYLQRLEKEIETLKIVGERPEERGQD